jgi:signal transduction histidine kinase
MAAGGASRSYPINVRTGAFGQFLDDTTSPGEYSDQRVLVEIYEPSGAWLTSIRLSEGPAFGNEIVRDVAQNSILAGVVAVLIAAAAGVWISRGVSRPVLALVDVTRQMAQGHLAIRAEIERRDEFGLLGETFNGMAARVEATVRTLKQFVADAAHEINTPLTALRTNLELITLRHAPEASRPDIQQALAELTRLERLTRGLLVLARLEAPDVARHDDPLDLTALIRQIVERHASRADQSEIELALEMPDRAVTIRGDQEQIARALDNLLDNALKFTPRSGRVTLGCGVDDEQARVWVRDTGIGIPENDLPNLFNRFHRGRNAAAFPGNGLGLVIAKAIVTDHGGQIVVESGAGGTCFTVTWPAIKAGE